MQCNFHWKFFEFTLFSFRKCHITSCNAIYRTRQEFVIFFFLFRNLYCNFLVVSWGEVRIISSLPTYCTSSAEPLLFHLSFSFQQPVVLTACTVIVYKQNCICEPQRKRDPNLHNTKMQVGHHTSESFWSPHYRFWQSCSSNSTCVSSRSLQKNKKSLFLPFFLNIDSMFYFKNKVKAI